MSAKAQSTLVKSTDLRTALVIIDLLQLRLQMVENLGHNVTAYTMDDDFFLEQSTDDDLGRAVSLNIPHDMDLVIVTFGQNLDFDIVELGGELIPVKPTPVQYTEAVRLCSSDEEFSGVKSLEFNIMELDLIVSFLMLWLFPTAQEVQNS